MGGKTEVKDDKIDILLIRHPNYSAILSKIHSYRFLFRWFCPLGRLAQMEIYGYGRLWEFCVYVN